MNIIIIILFISVILDFMLHSILTYMKETGIVLLRDIFHISWIVSRTVNLLALTTMLTILTFKELM